MALVYCRVISEPATLLCLARSRLAGHLVAKVSELKDRPRFNWEVHRELLLHVDARAAPAPGSRHLAYMLATICPAVCVALWHMDNVWVSVWTTSSPDLGGAT